MSRLVPLASPFTASLAALASRVHAWSAESQHVARRNAMIACTALATRRRDREEVEEYFAPAADRRAASGATRSALR